MEKILIADDHPLVRGALALAIEAAFGRAEILESASLNELVGQLGKIGVAELDIARRLATLTAQQVRVLQLLGTGKLNKEIAYELEIAEPTVKVHVSAILQKLKVYSRTQAAVLAGRLLSSEPLREMTTEAA